MSGLKCRCDNCYEQRPIVKTYTPDEVNIPLNITPGKWVQRDGGIAEVFVVRGERAYGEGSDQTACRWGLDGMRYGAGMFLGLDLIRPAPKTRDVWVVAWNRGNITEYETETEARDQIEASRFGAFAVKKITLTEGEGL